MQTLSIKRKPKGLYSAPEKPTETTKAKSERVVPKTEKSAPAKPKATGPSKAVKARRRKVDRLIKYWPELFNRDQPKPLKVGIFHDLITDIEAQGIEFGTGSLKAALAGYTQSTNYLKALAAGGQRYDLTGQPHGEVTPEQRTAAADSLLERSKDNAADS